MTNTRFRTDTQTKLITGATDPSDDESQIQRRRKLFEERPRRRYLNIFPFTRPDRPNIFVAQQIHKVRVLLFLL